MGIVIEHKQYYNKSVQVIVDTIIMGIVIEHKQYYNKKCTSHSRHYYYCTPLQLSQSSMQQLAQPKGCSYY